MKRRASVTVDASENVSDEYGAHSLDRFSALPINNVDQWGLKSADQLQAHYRAIQQSARFLFDLYSQRFRQSMAGYWSATATDEERLSQTAAADVDAPRCTLLKTTSFFVGVWTN